MQIQLLDDEPWSIKGIDDVEITIVNETVKASACEGDITCKRI